MLGATFRQTQFDHAGQAPLRGFGRSAASGRRPWTNGRLVRPLSAGMRALGAGMFAVVWTGLNLLARLGGLILAIVAVPLLLFGPALVVAMLVQLVSTALGDPSAV